MKSFDVIVIGAGGGTKIVSPAARLGLNVVVIEKEALGGTCLNRGCIPSKMLIHPADVAMQIKEAGRFHIDVDKDYRVDFAGLVTSISSAIDADSKSIETAYGNNPNIHFIRGHAKFSDDKTIRVNEEEITAEKIFIATGARPEVPPIKGLSGTPFMTSTEALRNTRLPKKLIVIGGGYIAVELGHAYAAFGAETHFIVRSHLVRREDWEVVAGFEKEFPKTHNVYFECVPVRVEYAGNRFTVTYRDNRRGSEHAVTGDALLVATGVTPNTDQLGLDNTRIRTNRGGFIQVDGHLRTGVDGVYAFGDCVGNYLFRHSVNWEGEYLFRTVFENSGEGPINYGPVPHAIFTHPQIAGVGKTEDQLKEEGIDYVVGLNHYKNSAKGMALRAKNGFVKILVEKQSRRLLGAHIIGPEASDMIHMIVALMYKKGTLDDLLNMVYIHPALPEIVRNAARRASSAFKKPETR